VIASSAHDEPARPGRPMLGAREIRPGLALFIDADVLVAAGASFTGQEHGRAHGPHYFVCIAAGDEASEWVATSSNPALGRILIRRKSGHPGWVSRPSYADLWQVWTATNDTVGRAAVAAGDASAPGGRHLAALRFLFDARVAV